MKQVYQAAHGVDAHMVRGLLEQAGIPAQVRGEYLQGALGEVPVSGMVTVWVAAGDAARARALVLEWERAAPDQGAEPPGHETAPDRRRTRRRGLVTGLVAAALLLPVLAWALMRLLG